LAEPQGMERDGFRGQDVEIGRADSARSAVESAEWRQGLIVERERP
jgi:hypothetical protein